MNALSFTVKLENVPEATSVAVIGETITPSNPVLGKLLPGYGYPLPLIFWNDGVRARLPPRSLRNKDLYVKYSEIRT
jgi:hypothetical protein